MTADAIYKKHRSNWSHQVSVMGTTQWLQRGQTLPLSVKGVACETMSLGEHHFTGSNPLSEFHSAHTIHLTFYYELLWQPVWLYHVNIKWHVPLAIPLITSLVPRPRPAFRHLQYGKARRAWYFFSRDHDVIGKLQKFAKLTGWVSRIFNRLHAQRSVCKTIASR